MSATAVRKVVSRLQPGGAPTDAELVRSLGPSEADREAAFAELVRRYGPMVLGACRGVLGDAHAAEDAFQAVFLVLARKADSIRPPGSVGGWLYGVAVRTARKAKTAAARRRRHEMAASASAVPALVQREGERLECPLARAELRAAVDAELAALPEMHRAAVVLCDLHGKTRSEVALELGRAEGTVASWLARGRKALAARLARRGVALPAAGVAAVVAPATVSAELCSAVAGIFAGRGAPESVVALAESVMKNLVSASTKLIAGVCAVGALLAAVATATAWHTNPAAPLEAPALAHSEPTAPLAQNQPKGDGFLDHSGFVYSVSYAPDGKTFVSVGGGRAIAWDAETRKKLFSVEGAEFARFSDDGKSLFVLVDDEFRTLDASTGKVRTTKKREKPPAVYQGTTATFAADGSVRVEFDGLVQHLRGDFKGETPALAGQIGRAKNDLGKVFGRGGAFSPDGSRFAGTHWKHDPQSNNGVLSVWNVATGARIGTLAFDRSEAPVFSFAWSPDGTELAVGRYNVEVYDAKTLKLSRRFDSDWGDITGQFSAVAWSQDGTTLAVGRRVERSSAPGRTGGHIVGITVNVQLLDARTGGELRRFDGFPDNLPVVSLAFRPDGKQLVCGAGYFPGQAREQKPVKDAKVLRVLNLDEPEKPAPMWKPTGEIELKGWVGGSVAYSLDGKVLFVGGAGGVVHAYDAATRKKLWEYRGEGPFAALALAPDGKQLVITTKDGVLFLNATTGKVGDALEVKGSAPIAVAYMPLDHGAPAPGGPSHKVIFGNADGYYHKTWRTQPKDAAAYETVSSRFGAKLADKYAVPLASDPVSKWVLLADKIQPDTGKNELGAWSAWDWKAESSYGEYRAVKGHQASVVCAAWSKDNKWFITGDANGTAITWDAATFKEKSRLSLGGRIAALATSPDGRFVAAAVVQPQEQKGKGAYTEEVFVWPAGERRPKPEPVSQPLQAGAFAGLASVAFAPDGESLAVAFANLEPLAKPAERNGLVRIFAVPKKEPDALTWVQQIVAAPDGKRYAVVPGGVFDASGKKLYDVPGDAVSFSPDGRTLFAMGAKAVLECDADTGKVRKEHPRPKTDFVWHLVRFSPDGKRYAAHFGFNVRVYDTATGFEPVRLSNQHEPGGGGTIFGTVGKDLVWSADGKQLVAVGVLTDASGKMGLAMWDTATGKRTDTHHSALDDGPLSAAFTPDGDRLAIGGTTGAAVWVVRGGADKNPERHYRTGGPVTAIAFAPDGKSLALGVRKPIPNGADAKPVVLGHKAEVWVFNAASAEEIKRFNGFEGVNHNAPTKLPVHALAFVGGNRIAAGTGYPPMTAFSGEVPRRGELKLFEVPSPGTPAGEPKWSESATLTDHKGFVNGVAVSPDGKSFAAATGTGVTVWNTETRAATTGKRTGGVLALAYSPDGKHLCIAQVRDVFRITAGLDKAARWTSGNSIWFGRMHALAYRPDGEWLAASDGYVTRVRRLAEANDEVSIGSRPKGAAPLQAPPAALAWSKDGKRLAFLRHENGQSRVAIWTPAAGPSGVQLTGHTTSASALAWSADGKLLVAGDKQGGVFAWDAQTDKELWRVQFGNWNDPRRVLGGAPITTVAISPAGDTVAVSVHLAERKSPERVVLLGAKDGKEIQHLIQDGTSPITSIAWAPDGKSLVTGSGTVPGAPLKPGDNTTGAVVVWERKP